MNISDLPKPSQETLSANSENDIQEDRLDVPELQGERYFSVKEGQDVTIYTEERTSRPWIGRIARVFPEKREFDIQWLSRVGKSNKYVLANIDGAPHIDRLEEDTVMFSEMR